MATIEELRQTLPYPQPYTPVVESAPGRPTALQVEQEPGGVPGLALRATVLCQDWDKRVVIHWIDEQGSHTLEMTRIIEDTPERFRFRASEEQATVYTLTPLTLETFNRYFREDYERVGHVPDFADEATLHQWLLRR